jgi:hypothetical protein
VTIRPSIADQHPAEDTKRAISPPLPSEQRPSSDSPSSILRVQPSRRS